MYRLHIRLGNLFRYSNDLNKAQDAYQKAVNFGLGHGHAYNQLAVVCQSKDKNQQIAVALSWYTRALSAVTDPFETANPYVQRLLQENQEWLA